MPERFSASVAGRHMACHASANLDLAIPGWMAPVEDRTKDNAANRGTARHELLEPIMAMSGKDIDGFAKILAYVAELRTRRRFNVLVEQEFTATWLDSQPKTTADLVLHVADEIHVVDFKWGKIPVEVYENEQLLFYAVCAAPLAPKAKGVGLHVLQPYADTFESWFVDTTRLAQFMADAQAAEAAIAKGSVQFGPTDHHCTFCPANPRGRGLKGRPLCPVLMQLHGYANVTDEDSILAL